MSGATLCPYRLLLSLRRPRHMIPEVMKQVMEDFGCLQRLLLNDPDILTWDQAMTTSPTKTNWPWKTALPKPTWCELHGHCNSSQTHFLMPRRFFSNLSGDRGLVSLKTTKVPTLLLPREQSPGHYWLVSLQSDLNRFKTPDNTSENSNLVTPAIRSLKYFALRSWLDVAISFPVFL